jgi:hypothetical protein
MRCASERNTGNATTATNFRICTKSWSVSGAVDAGAKLMGRKLDAIFLRGFAATRDAAGASNRDCNGNGISN